MNKETETEPELCADMSDESRAVLLHGKTKEFENLPANILGLDGWLLKVLPRLYRKPFLTGYEKLLRVAMHPDRCNFLEGKLSREGYLKSVAEATAYMLSGELEYDSAVDYVPRRMNFMVKLHEQLDAERTSAQLKADAVEEATRKLTQLSSELIETKSNLTRFKRSFDAQEKSFRLRREWLSSNSRIGVPLNVSELVVIGMAMKPGQACDKARKDAGKWRHEFPKPERRVIRDGCYDEETKDGQLGKRWRVLGCMAPLHLREAMKSDADFPDTLSDVEPTWPKLIHLQQVLLPFLVSGEALLMAHNPGDGRLEFELFVVKDSDYDSLIDTRQLLERKLTKALDHGRRKVAAVRVKLRKQFKGVERDLRRRNDETRVKFRSKRKELEVNLRELKLNLRREQSHRLKTQRSKAMASLRERKAKLRLAQRQWCKKQKAAERARIAKLQLAQTQWRKKQKAKDRQLLQQFKAAAHKALDQLMPKKARLALVSQLLRVRKVGSRDRIATPTGEAAGSGPAVATPIEAAVIDTTLAVSAVELVTETKEIETTCQKS